MIEDGVNDAPALKQHEYRSGNGDYRNEVAKDAADTSSFR